MNTSKLVLTHKPTSNNSTHKSAHGTIDNDGFIVATEVQCILRSYDRESTTPSEVSNSEIFLFNATLTHK